MCNVRSWILLKYRGHLGNVAQSQFLITSFYKNSKIMKSLINWQILGCLVEHQLIILIFLQIFTGFLQTYRVPSFFRTLLLDPWISRLCKGILPLTQEGRTPYIFKWQQLYSVLIQAGWERTLVYNDTLCRGVSQSGVSWGRIAANP